jgi:hypothetical protein
VASYAQLRPNGLPYGSGGYWFRYPGSTTLDGQWGYQQDNNDGTYFYGIMDTVDTFELDFTTYVLGGDQRCAGARLVSRIGGTSSGFQFNMDCWLYSPGYTGDGGWAGYNGTWGQWSAVWNNWFVAELSQAAINALRAVYRKLSGVTTPAVSESYIDLDIRTKPTVSITSPATDQRVFPTQPTVTWNYDSKGDTVNAHQVKVFTNAQVAAGGFNPDTSGNVWDSGRVGGAATSKQSGVALAHGGTYWFYVKLATDFLGGDWWSNWAAVRFIVNSPPVVSAVTVTPATPITTTNRPTIGWTFSDVDGDAQEHYYIRVFPESVYSALGFSPDSDTGAAWFSGAVANSGARSAQTGPLTPNVNYKAYVYATDLGSGTRWSIPAASGVFVIQVAPGLVFDIPAVPEVLGVTTDQDAQRLAVTLTGRDNYLTRNQASADTGTLGMEPDANVNTVTMTRDTATSLQGGASWKLTPLTLGVTTSFRSTRIGGRGPFPVTPGRTYTALGSSRSSTGTGRASQLLIRWFDAAGVLLSTTTGATTVDSNAAWTPLAVTAVAPAGAAWAEIVPQNVTPSEAHYWENLSFAPGSSTTWTRGGLAYELGALSDGFNRADSAVTLGSADVGGAWTAHLGTWGVSGNRAYLAAAGSPSDNVVSLSSAYLADGYVEADLTLSTVRANAGLVFRSLDNNTFLMARLVKTPANGNDIIELYKRVSGTYTQLAAVSAAGLVLGGTYKLRAEFYGGQVYVFVNGVQRIAYLMLAGELNQFGAYGGYGFYIASDAANGAFDDRASRFDNFRAGLVATQEITLQRSLDDGATWENVRNAVDLQPLGQQAIVYDYEVPAGKLARYRAITTASEAGNVVTSGYSATLAQTVALTIDRWWLKDAVDPALNMPITVAPPFQFRRKEPMQTFDPMGRKDSVWTSDGAKGIEGALNIWVKDRATYDQLEAILGNGRSLLLADPMGRSWWVKFADQDWEFIRAQPQATETTKLRHFHALSLPFVEVSAPAVI